MNRSKFILLPGIIILMAFSCKPPEGKTTWSGPTMGTTYHVTVYGPETDQAQYILLHDGIDSVLNSVNRQMSTWDPGSEISRFNTGGTEAMQISPEFSAVMSRALEISHLSDGAFDPTVGPLVDAWGFGSRSEDNDIPGDEDIREILSYGGMDNVHLKGQMLSKTDARLRLDLSAIAKGYGADAVAFYLNRMGYIHVLSEIGGEVAVSGSAGSRPWQLGIDRPDDHAVPGRHLSSVIAVSDCGIATSGDYRNFYMKNNRRISHTIDPRSGYPVEKTLASVTVIAPDCMTADGLATACMVLGEAAYEWISGMAETEAYFIFRNEKKGFREEMTPGFRAYLVSPKDPAPAP